jgi:hypothetical protein
MKKQEREFWIAIAALVVSLCAAAFTGMQWEEARQARIDAHDEAERQRQQDQNHFELARRDAEAAAKSQQSEVERSASSSERSAKAAEKNTEIAHESVQLNRQIFQISERAFVRAKGIDFSLEPNKPASVTVIVENAGRTTAKNTTILTNLALRDAPFPDHPSGPPPDMPLGSEITPVDLTAGDSRSTTIQTPRVLSEAEVKGVKDGVLYLYSYGHIEYSDAFSQKRRTTFCVQYNKDDQSKPHLCPSYNNVE